MTIPIINLIYELREKKVGLSGEGSKVRFKVIEDITGPRVLACVAKIRPRTYHINNKYRRFVKHVEQVTSVSSLSGQRTNN